MSAERKTIIQGWPAVVVVTFPWVVGVLVIVVGTIKEIISAVS